MKVRLYSKAARERLHKPGTDMSFGGLYRMAPEQAERLAYGLVERCRETGLYRRVQVCPVDEKMVVEDARAKDQVKAAVEAPPPGNRLRR